MINHARTLLLNLAGSPVTPYTYPGEEYIPTDFRPLIVPGWLQTLRGIVFGNKPDRAMMNYRAKELLPPLHFTELIEYVLAFDPRVTYVPGNQMTDELALGFQADQVVGAPKTIYFVGDLYLLRADRRLLHEYAIEVLNATDVEITYFDELINAENMVIKTYVITAGLSSLVRLPDMPIDFRFESGVGSKWLVSALASPVVTLSDMASRLENALSSELGDQLFGSATEEPWSTFKNLWTSHPLLTYRLGGAILALVYRMEELRG